MRLNMIAMKGKIQLGPAGFATEASQDRQVKPLFAAKSPFHRQVCLRVRSDARKTMPCHHLWNKQKISTGTK